MFTFHIPLWSGALFTSPPLEHFPTLGVTFSSTEKANHEINSRQLKELLSSSEHLHAVAPQESPRERRRAEEARNHRFIAVLTANAAATNAWL